MYIEDTGAGDGDIKINVGSEDYTAEANYDIDGDGVDDTVRVMTDDGYTAYVDENQDGQAEIMRTLDSHETVVAQARFAPGTGDWLAEAPEQHPHGGEPRPPADSMVLDTPRGDQHVGPATEDTNNDGRPDTAIIDTAIIDTGLVDTGQATMMATDVDGDGSVDQTVRMADTGEVSVSHRTGQGQWTVDEEGRIDQNGRYAPNPASHAVGTDDATWTFDEPSGDRRAGAADPAPGAAAPANQSADSDSVWC